MALAKLLDLDKVRFAQKLFGVLPLHACDESHPLLADGERSFSCPQSRHAGLPDALLEDAARAQRVRLLAHEVRAGYSLFESFDARFVMHLGHPEYTPSRLAFEYQRDRGLGRGDVARPVGVDLQRPAPRALPHGEALFARWLRGLRLPASRSADGALRERSSHRSACPGTPRWRWSPRP
jgi:homoserine O-succinyltransferase